MSRRPLIAGNWKMHLNHLEAIAHVQKISFALSDADHDAVDIAVLPPFIDLRSVQTLIDGDRLRLHLGAQDLSEHDAGAYTGDISGSMLSRIGCTYVVVGHSERRQFHGETDEVVSKKVSAALRHGLTPILCVGEGLHVREAGDHVNYTTTQVRAALSGVQPGQLPGIVIAYEPIWAIGTGKTATSADAEEVCAAIRACVAELDAQAALDLRVLYGGSVKATNIAELMARPNIDGALVGGASLDSDEFVTLCKYRLHPVAALS